MFSKKTKVFMLCVATIAVLVLLHTFLEQRQVKIFRLSRIFNASAVTTTDPDPATVISPPIRVPIIGNKMPRSVYYVWCQSKTRHFEFRNYLSVMSVLQNLKPDSVIFFYNEYPPIDSNEYNTWLSDILFDVPSFQTRKAPAHACLKNEKVNRTFLDRFLNEHYGIYINENVMVTCNSSSTPSEYCSFRRENVTEPRILFSPMSLAESTQLSECLMASELVKATEIPFSLDCLVIDRSIFPKNIWTQNDILSRVSRKIFYGNEEILQPTPSYSELAPNIAHMVWLGGGKMDFLFYLGVLSLLYIVEVDKVYVHGDLPPTGYYWSLFANDSRVEYIPHEQITMIYGKEIKSIQHMSDILRVEFMIKQGGIYMDTDVVFVKPLDKRIRAYDAVATYDWADCSHPFPEFINFGVSVGKKGARFWHLFQQTMRNFRDDVYILNGLQRPYKVMEKHPDLIFIEPHLQLQCVFLECHPTWIKDFHNTKNNHRNPSIKINWKTDVYAYHWTSPTPNELSSFESLMKGSGVFADIGKFIMNKSGMMDYFLQQQRNNTAHPV